MDFSTSTLLSTVGRFKNTRKNLTQKNIKHKRCASDKKKKKLVVSINGLEECKRATNEGQRILDGGANMKIANSFTCSQLDSKNGTLDAIHRSDGNIMLLSTIFIFVFYHRSIVAGTILIKYNNNIMWVLIVMRSGSGDDALSAVAPAIIIINFSEIYYSVQKPDVAFTRWLRYGSRDDFGRGTPFECSENTLVDRQCRALSADHRLDRRRSGRL